MADPRPNHKKRADSPSQELEATKLTEIQVMAAELLGRGYKVSEVAERMLDYIIQNSKRDRKTKLKMARNRIRAWQKKPEFRDIMWDRALIRLDLESPHILQGIARKAKSGRVDAAKLALELTERHLPKGEVATGPVNVIFSGVPRPVADIEGEVLDEELEA